MHSETLQAYQSLLLRPLVRHSNTTGNSHCHMPVSPAAKVSASQTGVFYSAFPINSEVREWLIEEGIHPPDTDGHAPTPQQLLAALETLDDQVVSFNIREGVWQAQIHDTHAPEAGPWAMINVLGYTSSDEPCKFCFEKGWPELIIKVVHRILNYPSRLPWSRTQAACLLS